MYARKPDRHGGLSLPNLPAELRPPVLEVARTGREGVGIDTQLAQFGGESFRALLLTKSYPTLDEASAFVAYTRGRIESLRAAWQTYLDSFVETITVVTPES